MIEPTCHLVGIVALWKKPSLPIPSLLLVLVALDIGVLVLLLPVIASFLEFCQGLKLEGEDQNRWSSTKLLPVTPSQVRIPSLFPVWKMICPNNVCAAVKKLNHFNKFFFRFRLDIHCDGGGCYPIAYLNQQNIVFELKLCKMCQLVV